MRLNRRALTLAAQPAAWHAAAVDAAWSLRGPCAPKAPPDPDPDTIVWWPSEYRHPNVIPHVEPLRRGLAEVAELRQIPIPQSYRGIVNCAIERDGVSTPVAVDFRDGTGIDAECLRESGVYFKMQHLREGYGDRRVAPGGYVGGKKVYDNYCRLRGLRRRGYRFEVYGRFSLRFATDVRRAAIEILERDTRFAFKGGTSLAFYPQSLREAVRSRVCVDLPGNGPLCYRLVDYLGLGCCVVARRHPAVLHAELRDGEHIVYCADDLSDLADLCARYADDDDERERIAGNAARFFDEHLHHLQLARYYLRTFRSVTDGSRA